MPDTRPRFVIPPTFYAALSIMAQLSNSAARSKR